MDRFRLRKLPKVELHNHLDGGLRVATVLELADAIGYDRLPSNDLEELSASFYQGDSGSLERYLAGFQHTVAVMQTPEAVERVAYESGLDLHGDGVVYAEVRFAPVLNTQRGMAREDAIEAALAGFRRAQKGTGTIVNLIVDAMRDRPDSVVDAKAAIRFAGSGVVGFDLAGPEAGYPAGAHAEACRIARDHGLGLTIHAGEADGPESIAAAIATCGAERIGHGIRIVDDIGTDGDGSPLLGDIARLVLERQIPLEVCPTSNLHTLGIQPRDHPLGFLVSLGFNVTLNTDNRLMSRVTLTDEFALAIEHHGMDEADLLEITLRAADASFAGEETRGKVTALVTAGYAS
jgi:adenosine deaminase